MVHAPLPRSGGGYVELLLQYDGLSDLPLSMVFTRWYHHGPELPASSKFWKCAQSAIYNFRCPLQFGTVVSLAQCNVCTLALVAQVCCCQLVLAGKTHLAVTDLAMTPDVYAVVLVLVLDC